MTIYVNATDTPVAVEIDTGDRIKTHLIQPGARISFNQASDNGPEILNQLTAAGAVALPEN